MTETSEYNLIYYMNLTFKQNIITVLQKILSISLLKNTDFFNFFLRNHTVFFSVKLKNIQKTNILLINIDDSFSFVFDRREITKE